MIITVTSSNEAPEIVGKRVICATADVSTSGMRLACKEKIPKGSALKIMIAITEPPRSFSLNGTVRWVKESSPPDLCFVGVQFDQNEPEAISAWKELVQQKLPKNATSELQGGFAQDDHSPW